jgi:hypothetical protein
MRKHRLAVFTLSGFLAFGAPVALAADTAATPRVTSQSPVVKVRPRVPQFPAHVKARREHLWNAASPAVRAWVKQVAPGIAKGPGDPEALARAAVQARWPNLHVAGAADALMFLALCDVDMDLVRMADERDSLADLSQEQQLKMQMVMDRMTKAESAASKLEQKISETASGIIANMK